MGTRTTRLADKGRLPMTFVRSSRPKALGRRASGYAAALPNVHTMLAQRAPIPQQSAASAPKSRSNRKRFGCCAA